MASDPPRSTKPQFLRPNENLKRKALNFEKGLGLTLSDQELVHVETAVDNSRDSFISQVAGKLRVLRQVLSAIGDSKPSEELIVQIRTESYAIKGLGATFGFPLLTAVAKSLNDYVEARETLKRRQVDVVRLHVDMLYVVLAERLTQIDPEREQELLNAFEALTAKIR